MPSLRFLVLMNAVLLLGTTAARAVDSAVLEAEAKRVAVVETVAPSVVAIFSASGDGGGSGVLISPDGYALSNFHVTGSAGDFMKCGLNDGVLYDAVIVGVDPTGDVALLKLLGRDDFPFATLGDSDTLRVGDWAFAMGNPFLLATDFHPTVTFGIVSGVHRYQYPAGTFLEYTDCIQVDSSINPGNSGGPLFNAAGELVGINGRGSFEKRGRVNVGAGYAISINQIKHFLDHLRSGRIVDHASLGATVRTGHRGAVEVDSILEHSEAYRRGLRDGDEIVSFAGRGIGSVNQFKNILGIYPKGWTLPLVFRQDNKKQEIYVQLRGLHTLEELTALRRERPMEPPEQPKDGKEPDKRKDPQKQPQRRPRRTPVIPGHEAPEPPTEYKHLLEKKPGFANYYFNRQERERVLKGVQSLGDFRSVAGVWQLTGRTSTGDDFTIKLADSGLGMKLKGMPSVQLLDGSDLTDEPQGSGGLLVALHHLRLLLTKGPQSFTEFYYLGSEPLDGRGETVDVLITVLTGVEGRWYFHKQTGEFVGFDTRIAEDMESCQVRFHEFGERDGRRLPSRFTVRSGGQDYATFEVHSIELKPATGGSAG